MEIMPHCAFWCIHNLGIRGAKIKIIFQGLYMTCVIHVLVNEPKFCIFSHQVYNCVLNLNIFDYALITHHVYYTLMFSII